MQSSDNLKSVNTRGWQKLPSDELKDLILEKQREAVRRHLDECEWRLLDRMRAHLHHAPEVSHR